MGSANHVGEWRFQPRKQLLHGAGAVPDHRALHRGQHVGVDVGGPRQKKPPKGGGGGDGRRAHAVARARCSTSPSSTTSLVSTRRTPSSPQSLSSWSETSLSIPFTDRKSVV